MAQHKVSFLENDYKNEKTGESARGVTVILDGKFGEVITQLKEGNPNYTNNIAVIQDALFRGINAIIEEQTAAGNQPEFAKEDQ